MDQLYITLENCIIYNQWCLGCGFTGMLAKFQQESSTPWHSKRRRRRTTELRSILKKSPCSPRMGASYRANLASIRGETAELRACRKKCGQTDRQTAFRLYIVDYLYSSKLIKTCCLCCTCMSSLLLIIIIIIIMMMMAL